MATVITDNQGLFTDTFFLVDAAGNKSDPTDTVTWSISDSTFATISPGGAHSQQCDITITKKLGLFTISASQNGFPGATKDYQVVTGPPVGSIITDDLS